MELHPDCNAEHWPTLRAAMTGSGAVIRMASDIRWLLRHRGCAGPLLLAQLGWSSEQLATMAEEAEALRVRVERSMPLPMPSGYRGN